VSVRFLQIIFRYVAAAEKHSYYGLQINLLKNSPGLTFSVLQPLNDHHTSETQHASYAKSVRSVLNVSV
jgi:hypothetical protein